MRRILSLLAIILVVGTSCEKKLMPETKTATQKEVFKELWLYVKEGYPLFFENAINWDTVYTGYNKYINDSLTDKQLFEICARMLDTLQDPNVILDAGFDRYQLDYSLKGPANFNEGLLKRNYWGGYTKTGPLIYTVIDTVGYIYLGSFKERLTDEHMDLVVNRFVNDSVKGLILDIRNNEGGDPENLITFLQRIDIPDTFHKKETLIYQTVYKTGPKSDKFSNVADTWVQENKEGRFPEGWFITLANRKCFGMANLAVSGCRAFPNGKVVGDTTGGGSGYPLRYELANGWHFQMPGSKSLTFNGINVEKGLAPDTVIYMNPADEAIGKDNILDFAIQEAKKPLKFGQL
jgi:hypothetical protein